MTARIRWMVTADERHATLLKCRRTPERGLHLESVSAIQNEWEDFHEHHRPDTLGRGASPSEAQDFAGRGHEDAEQQRRYCRDVLGWIHGEARVLGIEDVTLFAGPRLLGALRSGAGTSSVAIEFVEADIARLHPGELTQHNLVREAYERPVVHSNS